jgi:hypothetical protein
MKTNYSSGRGTSTDLPECYVRSLVVSEICVDGKAALDCEFPG